MIIGTFAKSGTAYVGSIKTLNIYAKVAVKPADKENDKAPDFRIFADEVELGAAWKRTSRDGREYLSVKLDDPSLAAPVYATLVAAEEGKRFNLIWSR